MAVFTKAESLLLNNSAVAFSTGTFSWFKTVTDAFPLCWANTIEVIKTHDSTKVNFLMGKRFSSKHRRKKRMT
jgi:hypothetical protein